MHGAAAREPQNSWSSGRATARAARSMAASSAASGRPGPEDAVGPGTAGPDTSTSDSLREHPESPVERIGDGVARIGADRQQAVRRRGREGTPDDLGARRPATGTRAGREGPRGTRRARAGRRSRSRRARRRPRRPRTHPGRDAGRSPGMPGTGQAARLVGSGRPATVLGEVIRRFEEHVIGRPRIRGGRASDTRSGRAVGCAGLGHPASITAPADGRCDRRPRRGRVACQDSGSTGGWRS